MRLVRPGSQWCIYTHICCVHMRIYIYFFKKGIYVYIVYMCVNICIHTVVLRLFRRLIKEATFKLQKSSFTRRTFVNNKHYQ